MPFRILIVDDEESIRSTFQIFLEAEGYDVESAENAQQALEQLQKGTFDVVVSDIIMPGLTGMHLLKEAKKIHPDSEVILITGEPNLETATEALRNGATDYISKPVTKQAILKSVHNALRLRTLTLERTRLEKENKNYQDNLENLVAERTRELESLHERYLQSQKMESLGRLAGGIAHDFNNLLTVIMMNADWIRESSPPNEELHESLNFLNETTERGRDLIGQLLAYGRKQPMTPRTLDLNRLIEEFGTFIRRAVRDDIEIEYAVTERPAVFIGDRGQIEQVLMNLAVNAQDAMPKGGKLTISTHQVSQIPQLNSQVDEDSPPGPGILVRFKDTGCGMSNEVRSQAFEPFFTTKEQGKGTGLGLSTVYGIVRQHQGQLEIETRPELGTTISIYLPLTTRPLDVKEDTPVAPKTDSGNESIIVAEDDEAVRRVIERVLTRNGYQVWSAANGKEALNLLAEHGQTANLLLTDVMMPGYNGSETATMARETYPELKVLFMSGYTAHQLTVNDQLFHGVYLKKPFSPNELTGKVRSILDQVPTGKR